MDEDKFNISMRKFLKQVGVTSQRAIEEHVRQARLEHGQLTARVVLTVEGTDLEHVVTGTIALD